ncbi:MAG: hypothetical protein LUG93_12895 [Lachnospiraceae bacterium]|nr:hypothetical protein [Lachnospiraceae bacterium]
MVDKLGKVVSGKQGNYILPFFWVHGESEEKLREYVNVIYDANIREFCVESRPHPDFCGPKWWETMDVILDEASKKNMRVWILDDAHFPTGYANGAIEEQDDRLRRQVLCYRTWECDQKTIEIDYPDAGKPLPNVETEVEKILGHTNENDNRVFTDDRCLGFYAFRLDTEENKVIPLSRTEKEGKLCFQVPEGKWRVYGLYLTRNAGFHRNYINMLSHESCKVLLDAVYEPHYEHYKKFFGNTIAGFFSDEPELGNGHLYETTSGIGVVENLPWSDELEIRLRKEWKEDFEKNLIYLWENEGSELWKASARHSYMDIMSQLVAECFSEQIGNWCREHHVEYIGHLVEDNGLHTRTGTSLGHYFRAQRGQTMSGIDDIGGQVFPQGEDISYNNDKYSFSSRDGEFYHYSLGKLGSSLAAIDANKSGRSVCEIFGNYGWAEGVQLEKYLADHFMVRGINHFVPHAFSAKEFPDPDCPPHFYAHGNNPQYRHFGELMKYMNRICELISDGKSCSKVALLYHAEGEWMGAYLGMDKVGHLLYDHQIDYDIIPQDVFTEKSYYHTVYQNERLMINENEYAAVIIPYMQYITADLAEAVFCLQEKHIPVVFAGGLPEKVCSGRVRRSVFKAETAELEQLADYLRDNKIMEQRISPSNDRIRCLHYQYENREQLFYIVNEGTATYEGRLLLHPGELSGDRIYAYDAWNNTCEKVEKEKDSIVFSLEPGKSIILMESDCEIACQNTSVDRRSVRYVQVNWNQELWKRSKCRSIDYPDFAEAEWKKIPDQMHLDYPKFSGFAAYENSFICENISEYRLTIMDAGEGVEVFINDRSLGIQIVPVYQYVIPEEMIRKGENRVRIEVATTLERQMSVYPTVYGTLPEPPTCKSGITGAVLLEIRE